MSALANHAFAKMNGIGNEIVVVDLRDARATVTRHRRDIEAAGERPSGDGVASASRLLRVACAAPAREAAGRRCRSIAQDRPEEIQH